MEYNYRKKKRKVSVKTLPLYNIFWEQHMQSQNFFFMWLFMPEKLRIHQTLIFPSLTQQTQRWKLFTHAVITV